MCKDTILDQPNCSEHPAPPSDYLHFVIGHGEDHPNISMRCLLLADSDKTIATAREAWLEALLKHEPDSVIEELHLKHVAAIARFKQQLEDEYAIYLKALSRPNPEKEHPISPLQP
jgi:hypothetical protein